jgi:hypothetical protein
MVLLVLCFVGAGCDGIFSQNPPPEVTWLPPEGGILREGDAIELEFSEPIVEETLVVQIWSAERDIEGELVAEEPILANCKATEVPCGDLDLWLSEDRMRATLWLDSEGLGQPDVPLSLEVRSGLIDDAGEATGVSFFVDFQFAPLACGAAPASLEQGTWILGGTVEEPIPGVVLTLISDIRILQDGSLALAGIDGNAVDGAAKNTRKPDELVVNLTDQSYGIHAVGCVTGTDSDRFLETEAFDVHIQIGPIGIDLEGGRLNGKVTVDPDTGHDRLDSTLSFETIFLDSGTGEPFDYGAGSVTMIGSFIPPSEVPEGAPTVCGLPCGALRHQCTPPADFPPAEFCEEADE